MSTLVTGATGCLGSNLVPALLERGERVRIFKPADAPMGSLGAYRDDLEVTFGDIRDRAAVHAATGGVDRVFHIAGFTVPLDRLVATAWEINVVGTANVGLAALAAGVERVVHVSSSAAIGYPPDGVEASEDFDYGDSVATTVYSTTKRQGEELMVGCMAAGLDVVVVNPTAVLAPGGDLRNSWARMVRELRKGLLRLVPPGGTGVCTHEDLVAGLCAAMNKGESGRRYLLNSANLTYAELGAVGARVVGGVAPRGRVPRPAAVAAARFNAAVGAARRDKAKGSLLVPETADLMYRKLFYDSSRARSELGVCHSGDVAASFAAIADWLDNR